MLLCDGVILDPARPTCTHIECLMSSIVSEEDPPFPLLRESFCIYLVLTDCVGRGRGQIRVAYVDGEEEQALFGSPERTLDFAGHSPLELLGVTFRIRDCQFPHPGQYVVQFWYNGAKIEERPLRLR
jgi:hypothetical protein